MKLESFINCTPERQSEHSKRQTRRSGYARISSQPDGRLWNFYREYAKCRQHSHGESVVNEKAISFHNGLILPFLIDSHIALAKCRLVWKILLRNDRALCIHIEFQPPQQKNLLMIITFSHILFAVV